MRKFKSIKADAWQSAALLIQSMYQDHVAEDKTSTQRDNDVIKHMLKAVVPALKRKAAIIERNKSRRDNAV